MKTGLLILAIVSLLGAVSLSFADQSPAMVSAPSHSVAKDVKTHKHHPMLHAKKHHKKHHHKKVKKV